MGGYSSRRFSSTKHTLLLINPPHSWSISVKLHPISLRLVKADGDLMSPGGGCRSNGKDLVMRLAICVSLALAAGVTSFGASACSNSNEYNNNMTEVQQKYKVDVAAANKTYVDGRRSTVELVYANTGRRVAVPQYYYMVRDDWMNGQNWQNWQNWQNAVNAAVAEYTTNAQAAYNNYICNW
jgi:hypothetical protein